MALQSTSEFKPSDELSLYGLFSLFIKNWLILVISGLGFATLALIWAINQPNIYKAETLLMAVEEESSGLSGLSGSLGGLASMAGVNLGDDGDSNTKLALELVKSRQFISDFIQSQDLLVPIMAAEGWDMPTDSLIISEDIYDVANNTWVRKAKAPRQSKPSAQEAYEKFVTMLNVEQQPKTKFVRISVEFYSPSLAAKWTRDLVEMLNKHIRNMDKKEAEKSIAYLKELTQSSNVVELRRVFSGLMEEQIKSQMIAEVRQDYVFKVIDPAVAPEQKSKPQRAIIIIIAGFLGGVLGLIIILFRSGKQSHLAKMQ
jgi:uncharacterized protein involved in exopolysaccharide biosynthesis